MGASRTSSPRPHHFLTTATGKQYGTFHGKLAQRHQRDRQKRRRKAKLRACLKKKGAKEGRQRRAPKKGAKKLPATRTQKRARHVRQESNRAVNEV
jgi:hypothetical protein